MNTPPDPSHSQEYRFLRFVCGVVFISGMVVSGVGLLLVNAIQENATLRDSAFAVQSQQLTELRAEYQRQIADDKASRFKEAMAWVAWRSELARQIELKFEELKQEAKP